MELTQGGKTIREYVTQFDRLSHFVPHMVDTPQKKIKKFHHGLDTHLRHMTLGHLEQTFEALVRLASSLERDGYKGTPQPTNRPFLKNRPRVRPQNRFNKRPWSSNNRRPQQTLSQN